MLLLISLNIFTEKATKNALKTLDSFWVETEMDFSSFEGDI